MLRDITNPKKLEKQAVVTAIALLKAKAWDINPYTVADELKVPRANIYRNGEIMELISEARAQAGIPGDMASDQLIKRASELEQQNRQFEERIEELEQENLDLRNKSQESWQLGYKAGWEEAGSYLGGQTTAAPNEADQFEPLQETELAADVSESNIESDIAEADQYSAYTEEFGAPEVEAETGLEEESDEEVEAVSADELQNLLKQHLEKSENDSAQGQKSKGLAASKFARVPEGQPRGFVIKTVPPDIRKACLVLGLRPEEVNRESINDAWKREITRPGTHPDQGGDTEIAVYLNTAKDQLLNWWISQEPKLAKHFGTQAKPQSKPNNEPENDENIETGETEPTM